MSVLFKMVDASGVPVTGATVTVTVDGQAGTGTVTEVGSGWYRYTFGTGEGAQPCVVKATATLCQAVEIAYDPTWAKQATLASVQSDVSAVKAKTDSLAFSAGGDIKATLDGEQVVVAQNLDKTGYALTSDYDAAKVAASQASVDALDADIQAISQSVLAKVLGILANRMTKQVDGDDIIVTVYDDDGMTPLVSWRYDVGTEERVPL